MGSAQSFVRLGNLVMSSTPHKKVIKALTVIALTVGGIALSGNAIAADLYSEGPPPSYGPAYDDPRYADLYGRPPARVETYRSDTYRSYETPRYYEPPPIPRADVYQDERRYADRAHRDCPTKAEISRRLERDGWGAFRNPQVIDRDTATIDAQRPNGRPFRLEVDRCTGEVLAQRPLDRPRYGSESYYGPYADNGRRPLRSY